ncbi:MAG TPA: phosphatidylglycerophosphatase A [Candidatus Acidoferrales bacterium]|nr:phosphatidylglycerophosphatase A [Candidatus Acidoferrales bacterium]
MSADSGAAAPGDVTTEASNSVAAAIQPQRKPRLALFIATACGLGYIPVAPGTWGSLAGCGLWILTNLFSPISLGGTFLKNDSASTFTILCYALAIAAIGVWASDKTANFVKTKDPQFVVVDEVSGQYIALFLGIPLDYRTAATAAASLHSTIHGESYVHMALLYGGLKYLLLGFILFRVFDIWKPFPARQAESLPGGWGIMADDWIAGVYAAIGLWLARAAGL